MTDGPLDSRTAGDEQLLGRLRAGDEQAFRELVDRYRAPMLRLARLHVPSDAVAEEVVQESWVGLLTGLDRFEQRASLKTWLLRIVLNRAITRGQREARTVPFSALERDDVAGPTVSPERFAPDGAWSTPPRPFELPEARAAALELRAQVRHALAQLPESQRAVVALHDVEGLATEEIATMLQLTPGNVRVLLHRGRARVQKLLDDYLTGRGQVPSPEARGAPASNEMSRPPDSRS